MNDSSQHEPLNVFIGQCRAKMPYVPKIGVGKGFNSSSGSDIM